MQGAEEVSRGGGDTVSHGSVYSDTPGDTAPPAPSITEVPTSFAG
jgi:hypothetical protein